MLIDTYSEHTHCLSMATAGLLTYISSSHRYELSADIPWNRHPALYIMMCDLRQAVFPKKCQWPFGACLPSPKRRIDVYSSGTAQASHLIPFSSQHLLLPQRNEDSCEPIAAAKVNKKYEPTKVSCLFLLKTFIHNKPFTRNVIFFSVSCEGTRR